MFYNRIQITFGLDLFQKFNHFIWNVNLKKFHLLINWFIHSLCSIEMPKSSNWFSRFYYVLSDSNTGPASKQEGQHTTYWARWEAFPNCIFWSTLDILCCQKIVSGGRDSRLLFAILDQGILLLRDLNTGPPNNKTNTLFTDQART